jgi:transcriptional regulator with XRE-family HTH domain
MRITDHLTDVAIATELGRRLAQTRLERNLTQAQVAERAGISRRSLVDLENGRPANIRGFLRVLRALGMASNLEALVPEPTPAPLARTTRDRPRQRARPRAEPEQGGEGPVWGDER